MSESDDSTNNKSSGKAVTYGGGTGVGAILIQIIDMCPNEKVKGLLTVCVPPLSIGIAEYGTILWNARKKTPDELKADRERKRDKKILAQKIKDAKKLLKDPSLSDESRKDIQATLFSIQKEQLDR